MALLILLSAPARAGVVATDDVFGMDGFLFDRFALIVSRRIGRAELCRGIGRAGKDDVPIGGRRGYRGGMRRFDLEYGQKIRLAYRVKEAGKEAVRLAFVFDERIALTVATQPDALSQVLDLVEMIHPQLVERLHVEWTILSRPAL